MQRLGQDFLLLGSRSLPSAYSVAAGVINPVTGRWMTKTWNADHLLPLAEQTYREIEKKLGIQIYHPIPEIRFCQNEDDVKRVGRRIRNPRYADVLGAYLEPGKASAEFTDLHGSFEIKGAAYVDLPKLVDSLRSYFSERGQFRDEVFDHEALTSNSQIWTYGDLSAETVIFCQGAATNENPWFKNLALNPVKGETLLCQSKSLQLPHTLYHHKKWLLPYPDGSFRIGATYDEDDLSPEPTQAKAEELLDAARGALKKPHEIAIQSHLAGLRPSTIDNRPIVGQHPSEKGLYVLNGLGSKGASTGPAMAKILVDHLIAIRPIEEEVSISRFT
jgi:glycine/D-amino acid oxidase-like deaminating enzyme